MTIRFDEPLLLSLDGSRPTIRPSTAALRLSGALAIVTALACALILFASDVLTGPAVMNGSARGTALIVLFLTLPAMVLGMVATARTDSAFGLLVWAGAVAHVLYQSVLFLFATPFNDLFLLLVGMLGLALWSVFALVASVDARVVRARISDPVPVRAVAIYIWVVVALNALAWLAIETRAVLEDGFPSALEGTGMTTNPIHVQDLAFWLPLMAVSAWWLWRRQDRGYLLVGAMLTMWLLESVTVAVDQWMGSDADPASRVATREGAVVFGALAVISVVPWAAFYRRVQRR